MELKDYIRDVPDFPTQGILFRDITPLLETPEALRHVVDRLSERYGGAGIDSIVAIESRGFLFGAPLAYRLGKPLVLARKEGKLPGESFRSEYSLEYGSAVVEMHKDAIKEGDRALIIDDLLATGGTLAAAARLVEEAGGKVDGIATIIELTALEGRKRIDGYNFFTLVKY